MSQSNLLRVTPLTLALQVLLSILLMYVNVHWRDDETSPGEGNLARGFPSIFERKQNDGSQFYLDYLLANVVLCTSSVVLFGMVLEGARRVYENRSKES